MNDMDELFELSYRKEEDFWKEQNKVLPYAVNCQELKRIVSFSGQKVFLRPLSISTTHY